MIVESAGGVRARVVVRALEMREHSVIHRCPPGAGSPRLR
ncbi:MAG: hypothetical protein L6R45_07865 [Anaerolineae bacterium]|nr:hypothetical protein [Anaerolineae bacterium]